MNGLMDVEMYLTLCKYKSFDIILMFFVCFVRVPTGQKFLTPPTQKFKNYLYSPKLSQKLL